MVNFENVVEQLGRRAFSEIGIPFYEAKHFCKTKSKHVLVNCKRVLTVLLNTFPNSRSNSKS